MEQKIERVQKTEDRLTNSITAWRQSSRYISSFLSHIFMTSPVLSLRLMCKGESDQIKGDMDPGPRLHYKNKKELYVIKALL